MFGLHVENPNLQTYVPPQTETLFDSRFTFLSLRKPKPARILDFLRLKSFSAKPKDQNSEKFIKIMKFRKHQGRRSEVQPVNLTLGFLERPRDEFNFLISRNDPSGFINDLLKDVFISSHKASLITFNVNTQNLTTQRWIWFQTLRRPR